MHYIFQQLLFTGPDVCDLTKSPNIGASGPSSSEDAPEVSGMLLVSLDLECVWLGNRFGLIRYTT